MKVDWTIISHYITQSFSSWMVGRICIMNLGLKGRNSKRVYRNSSNKMNRSGCLSYSLVSVYIWGRDQLKWRQEHLGALGIMGEAAPLISLQKRRATKTATTASRERCLSGVSQFFVLFSAWKAGRQCLQVESGICVKVSRGAGPCHCSGAPTLHPGHWDCPEHHNQVVWLRKSAEYIHLGLCQNA